MRANLAMGSRFVQVAEAAPGAELLRGALDWGPLRPLRIDGFSPAAAGRPDDMNNLYFLAAHVLPRQVASPVSAGWLSRRRLLHRRCIGGCAARLASP